MHVYIRHSTQTGSQSTKKKKEVRNKRDTNENGEVKLFLSANGIILYTQKPNISTRKPVKLVNSSVTRYKHQYKKQHPFYTVRFPRKK